MANRPNLPTESPAHEKLYEDALAAINLVFGDGTVSPETVFDSLKELKGEINVMLDALDSDREENSVYIPEDDE